MDIVPVKGRVRGIIRNQDGNIDSFLRERNLVVNDGLYLIGQLIGSSGVQPSHMAIGDNGDATTKDMTTLQGSEHSRIACDSINVVDNEITYKATFGSNITGDATVREGGIFNDASAGVMLCRFVTGEFTLFSGQSCEVEWILSIGE